MKNILLDHKINSFRKMKEDELGLRRKNVDQMIEDLVSDGRNTVAY